MASSKKIKNVIYKYFHMDRSRKFPLSTLQSTWKYVQEDPLHSHFQPLMVKAKHLRNTDERFLPIVLCSESWESQRKKIQAIKILRCLRARRKSDRKYSLVATSARSTITGKAVSEAVSVDT